MSAGDKAADLADERSTSHLREDLEQGRLVRVLPDEEPEVLGIHAIYLSRQHQPFALRLLVDFLA